MAKNDTFACSACGARSSKWAGRCEACSAWNTITEDAGLSSGPGKKALGNVRGRTVELSDLSAADDPMPRTESNVAELDRVLGGGLVAASAVLLGGDPGIGKSTLLLQATAAFAKRGLTSVYISGEESAAQVRMRARRLGLEDAAVRLGAETNLRNILTTLEAERPDLVVIDSIQTMWLDTVDSAPGSVSQVRATAHELVSFAKRNRIAVILVGHVTKDGQIAGPRVVEHMVDTVLYFEGERGMSHRILRAVKNRFGPADEIGVFEMTGKGLAQVRNPSALFLTDRDAPVPGAAVFAGIEGTRPVLCEFQALVAASPLGQPRRQVLGWDSGRLAMILAVLDARAGISFAGMDVYLNIAGGLRVSDPSSDLAVAAALLSAVRDAPLAAGTVLFGELSLSGALRPAGLSENRLKEAGKLGFSRALVSGGTVVPETEAIETQQYPDLTAFVGAVFGTKEG